MVVVGETSRKCFESGLVNYEIVYPDRNPDILGYPPENQHVPIMEFGKVFVSF